MGLDMYLSAERYIGDWDHDKETERQAYKAVVAAAGLPGFRCDGSPHLVVKICVAYWRKANQIHAWFVENVQNGEDECKPHSVTREQLQELVALCEKAIADEDASLLTPRSGFFFGSTEIEQWYWDDLKGTIAQLKPLLENKDMEHWGFVYRSSW
jgi:hypothetical protein